MALLDELLAKLSDESGSVEPGTGPMLYEPTVGNETDPVTAAEQKSADAQAALLAAITGDDAEPINKWKAGLMGLADALRNKGAGMRGAPQPESILQQLRDRRERSASRDKREGVAKAQIAASSAERGVDRATRKSERDEGIAAADEREATRQRERVTDAAARKQELADNRQGTLDAIEARQAARSLEGDAAEAKRVNALEDESNAAAALIIQDLFEGDGVNPPLVTQETTYEDAVRMFRRRLKTIPRANMDLAMMDFEEELEAMGIRPASDTPVVAPPQQPGGVGGGLNTFFERLTGTFQPPAEPPLVPDPEKAANFQRIADILKNASQ